MFADSRYNKERASYGLVLGLVISFFVVGLVWFFFSSGFWDIKKIEINDLATLDRAEVENEVWRIVEERSWRPWHKKNLLLIDENKLSAQLKERLFVLNVVVDKSYPNILRLKIEERQRSVILVVEGLYLNVDTSGLVTSFVDGDVLKSSQDLVAARAFADDQRLPVIILKNTEPMSVGFQAAKPEEVKRWLDVCRSLVLGGLKYRFMKIETADASLGRFVSERGYDIYFNLKEPIEEQLATYLAYMKTKPDESKILEYMDVRVPGKIYIK